MLTKIVILLLFGCATLRFAFNSAWFIEKTITNRTNYETKAFSRRPLFFFLPNNSDKFSTENKAIAVRREVIQSVKWFTYSIPDVLWSFMRLLFTVNLCEICIGMRNITEFIHSINFMTNPMRSEFDIDLFCRAVSIINESRARINSYSFPLQSSDQMSGNEDKPDDMAHCAWHRLSYLSKHILQQWKCQTADVWLLQSGYVLLFFQVSDNDKLPTPLWSVFFKTLQILFIFRLSCVAIVSVTHDPFVIRKLCVYFHWIFKFSVSYFSRFDLFHLCPIVARWRCYTLHIVVSSWE